MWAAQAFWYMRASGHLWPGYLGGRSRDNLYCDWWDQRFGRLARATYMSWGE